MNTKQSKIYFVLTILFAVLILYFSLTPEPPKIQPIINFDKVLHLCSYFILSFLCYKTINNMKISIISAGTYGLLIEIMQLLIPMRSFELLDILINYIGAGLILIAKFTP